MRWQASLSAPLRERSYWVNHPIRGRNRAKFADNDSCATFSALLRPGINRHRTGVLSAKNPVRIDVGRVWEYAGISRARSPVLVTPATRNTIDQTVSRTQRVRAHVRRQASLIGRLVLCPCSQRNTPCPRLGQERQLKMAPLISGGSCRRKAPASNVNYPAAPICCQEPRPYRASFAGSGSALFVYSEVIAWPRR